MSRAGWIGLSPMGEALVQRLLTVGGQQVVLHDRSAEATVRMTGVGAVAAQSPAEVAAQAQVIFLSLPDPRSAEEAVCGRDGLLTRLARFHRD